MNAYEKQTAALRAALVQANGKRELYARVIGCLVNAYHASEGLHEAGGHVAIPAAEIEMLPDVSTVSVERAVMAGENDGDDDIPIVVLKVEPKDVSGNGRSKIIIPKNRLVL